ncbi:MAG: RNA-binding cell elongation regulator Jag/EloR [Cetobacterium sp.]
MRNTIEVKAMSKEKAIERALKILEATSDQIVRVEEKVKSKSFFGFFNKEGVYEIQVDKTEKSAPETPKAQEKEEPKTTEKPAEKPVEKKKVEKAQKSQEVLTKANELLENMGLELKAETLRYEGKNITINLYGEDNGIIIGKKGKTLNSFEYLLNTLVKDVRVEVDVEGFKEKRNNTLRDLGRKMAEKALHSTKPVRLNPMPPRERKIIHEVINKYTELDTFSEGKDPKRYIVIKRKK